MIFSTRKFGRERRYPQLHHVMDFPFPSHIPKSIVMRKAFWLALKSKVLSVGFWQKGFLADFYLEATGFCRGFVTGFFLLVFVGESAQENPRQNPPKFIQHKSSTHISAEWPGQKKMIQKLPRKSCGLECRAKRNACDSDSCCGLACDASVCDAKSLAMWGERREPLSPAVFHRPYISRLKSALLFQPQALPSS